MAVFDDPGAQAPASAGNAGHIAVEQHAPLASLATLRSLPHRLMSLGGPVSFPPGAIGHWLPFGLRLLRAVRRRPASSGERRRCGPCWPRRSPAWRRLMQDVGTPDLLRLQGNIVAWESVAGARRARAALRNYASPVAHGATSPPRRRDCSSGLLRLRPADAVCARNGQRRRSRRGSGRPARGLPGPRRYPRPAVLYAGGRAPDRGRPDRDRGRRALGPADARTGISGAAHRGAGLPHPGCPEPLAPEPALGGLRGARPRGDAVPLGPAGDGLPRVHPSRRAARSADWARLTAHAAPSACRSTRRVETWVGSRPTLPDYLPAIGRSARDPRVLYAFGHQHLGLTLGPVTGEIVAALACRAADRRRTSALSRCPLRLRAVPDAAPPGTVLRPVSTRG